MSKLPSFIFTVFVSGCATLHNGTGPAMTAAGQRSLFRAPSVDSHWAGAGRWNDADDLTFAPLIEASVLALENWIHSRRNASSQQLAGGKS